MPSPIFAKLAPQLPDDYRTKLLSLDYEAAVVVLLEMDRALSDVYWMNIADPSMPFTAIIEHTNFVAPGNYNGKHYVYLSKYLETDDPYFTMPEDEVIESYLPHLRKVNKRLRQELDQQLLGLSRARRPADHHAELQRAASRSPHSARRSLSREHQSDLSGRPRHQLLRPPRQRHRHDGRIRPAAVVARYVRHQSV